MFEHGDGSSLVEFELRYWLNCSMGAVLSGERAQTLSVLPPRGFALAADAGCGSTALAGFGAGLMISDRKDVAKWFREAHYSRRRLGTLPPHFFFTVFCPKTMPLRHPSV